MDLDPHAADSLPLGLATKVLDLSGGGDEIARKPLVFHSSYDKWVEMTGHEAPGVHH